MDTDQPCIARLWLRTTGYKTLLAIACAALCLSRNECQAGLVTLGEAGGYALFAGPYVDTFSFNGPSVIFGDPGNSSHYGDVAMAANGKYNFASPGLIHAALLIDGGVTGTNSGVVIDGGIQSTNLSQAVLDAQSAAAYSQGLANVGATVAGNTIVVTNPSNAVTINGLAGNNVLHLTDINLNNGNLTINGGPNDYFAINVSGKFIVNGSANILLTGGIGPANVLFNVTGTGQDVSITGSTSSHVNGILMALSRNLTLHDKIFTGEIIGAFGTASTSRQISITSGFQLNVPEPSTFILAGFGLAGLLACRRRKR
ncbi:MAG TPA: PEP-CTERM sorting domain-containing protein [Pirellulales bacterium]